MSVYSNSNIILTTGNDVEGYKIEKYLGVICEEVVFKNSFMNSLSAGFEGVLSSFRLSEHEMSSNSSLVSNARDYLMKQFVERARCKNADAVIGIDFETSLGSDIVRVSVNGTAVKTRKIENRRIGEETFPDTVKDGIIIDRKNGDKNIIPDRIFFLNGSSSGQTKISVGFRCMNQIKGVEVVLKIHDIFGDEYISGPLKFAHFSNVDYRYVTEYALTDIPEEYIRTAASIKAIIKRYISNQGEIIVLSEDDSAVWETIETSPEGEEIVDSKELVKLLDKLKKLSTAADVYEYIQNNYNPEPGTEFKEAMMNKLKKYSSIEKLYVCNKKDEAIEYVRDTLSIMNKV